MNTYSVWIKQWPYDRILVSKVTEQQAKYSIDTLREIFPHEEIWTEED